MRRISFALLVVLVACGGGDDLAEVRTAEPVDPLAGEWWPIADAPVPELSSMPTVWTGDRLYVWGGGHGAAYDPISDRWEALPDAPLEPRVGHALVWSGTELLVWGGQSPRTPPESLFGDGAAYNPTTRTWRPMSPAPVPARAGHEAVWDGDELLVWGGIDACCPIDSIIHRPDAAIYDPAADTWRTVADVPEPWSGDDGQALTVAESAVIVWRRGHLGTLGDDGAWRALPDPPEVEPPTAFSTAGPSVVGHLGNGQVRLWTGEWRDPWRGFAYDIDSSTWRRIADLGPADHVNIAPTAGGAWAVIHREDADLRVAHYDAEDDRWRDLPPPPLDPRWGATVTDTPTGVLVWGGSSSTGEAMTDGAVFGPARSDTTSAPTTTQGGADDAAFATFLEIASRHGKFGPFPLPGPLVDAADLLPSVDWQIKGRDDDQPSDDAAVLSTEPTLATIGRISAVVPLLGRYSRPDGDISVPEYVDPDDPRAEELFVGLELSELDVIDGGPPDETVQAGLLIAAGDLGALRDAVNQLPPMLWLLGTAERSLFAPVAESGVYAPTFPWFATIGTGGELAFPLLEDDHAFTARTGTVGELRREAQQPRTVTVFFDMAKDDYVQVDDGRQGPS